MGVIWLPQNQKPLPGQPVDWDAWGMPKPLGEWWLNEGGGDRVFDASGNSRVGTLNGAVVWDVGNLYFPNTGSSGSSNVTYNDASLPTARQPSSILCEFRALTANRVQVVCAYGSASTYRSRDLVIVNPTTIQIDYYGYFDNLTIPSGGNCINAFYNLLAIYDGTNSLAYWDGTLSLSPVAKTSVNTLPSQGYVGRHLSSSVYAFEGWVRRHIIWPVALTASQVAALQGPVPIWSPQRYWYVGAGAVKHDLAGTITGVGGGTAAGGIVAPLAAAITGVGGGTGAGGVVAPLTGAIAGIGGGAGAGLPVAPLAGAIAGVGGGLGAGTVVCPLTGSIVGVGGGVCAAVAVCPLAGTIQGVGGGLGAGVNVAPLAGSLAAVGGGAGAGGLVASLAGILSGVGGGTALAAWEVIGAGSTEYNGLYVYAGVTAGKPYYDKLGTDKELSWDTGAGAWELWKLPPFAIQAYRGMIGEELPAMPWSVISMDSPAPTMVPMAAIVCPLAGLLSGVGGGSAAGSVITPGGALAYPIFDAEFIIGGRRVIR